MAGSSSRLPRYRCSDAGATPQAEPAPKHRAWTGTGYQHPFDLARCAPPADICNLLTFGACIPGFDPWQCVLPAP